MSSENRKFEDEWKHAFADAEGDVNQSVWVNIDSKLANAESGAMKKRVLFYQLLAAASVVLAMVAGGVLFIQNGAENQPSLSHGNSTTNNITDSMQVSRGKAKDQSNNASLSPVDTPAPTALTTKKETSLSLHKNQTSTAAAQTTQQHAKSQSTALSSALTDNVIVKSRSENNTNEERVRIANPRKETVATNIVETPNQLIATENIVNESVPLANTMIKPTEKEAPTVDSTAIIESPIRIAQNKVAPEPTITANKKAESSENWWASLNGSAGSYTTGGTAPSTAFQSNTGGLSFQNSGSGSSSPRVGTAFSYGVNVGKRVAPRWVIMSGVGYMTQSINYPSSSAVFSSNQAQAFIADMSRASASPTVSVASYELTSVNEFVTIPLQAGYLLVNRKVGVQLNAGVASDIFLRNTLSDPAGRLSTSSQSAGDASTYKTVNWSGLVGTELSYKISTHYRISVIPGMRYSFDSILKSNVNGSITPLIWDVGFRFKYIF
ncbi:MAG: outer membrane beta-barrel protein [Bacteroidota bacterium]|jgi:hypothetical protein